MEELEAAEAMAAHESLRSIWLLEREEAVREHVLPRRCGGLLERSETERLASLLWRLDPPWLRPDLVLVRWRTVFPLVNLEEW